MRTIFERFLKVPHVGSETTTQDETISKEMFAMQLQQYTDESRDIAQIRDRLKKFLREREGNADRTCLERIVYVRLDNGRIASAFVSNYDGSLNVSVHDLL